MAYSQGQRKVRKFLLGEMAVEVVVGSHNLRTTAAQRVYA